MSCDLWLIRHGETEWSRSGAHTGRTDLPLTDAGVKAALSIGDRLAGRVFTQVITSPMSRAMETCRLAGYAAGAFVDPNLCEWNYGDYEGRTTPDIRRENPDWSLWRDGVPNGESIDEVAARARCVIEKACQSSGNVALFGHGHILRILAATWLGLAPQAGALFALATASISRLGYEREVRVMTLWNDTGSGTTI
jgi:broad specificity phosphatase PhoE